MARTKTTESKQVTAQHGILKHPRITEKAATVTSFNVYVFDILPTVTKSEVAKAFFAQYDIKPVKVNVVNNKQKAVYRRGVLGFKAGIKKAYVYLPKGKTIDIV